jgi:hypothetical protein
LPFKIKNLTQRRKERKEESEVLNLAFFAALREHLLRGGLAS